jgi:dienelactone hydrolase
MMISLGSDLLCVVFQSEAAQALKAVVEDLKAKGIRYIGAVGFCWGGTILFLRNIAAALIDHHIEISSVWEIFCCRSA